MRYPCRVSLFGHILYEKSMLKIDMYYSERVILENDNDKYFG
jgi:hypothetical protein